MSQDIQTTDVDPEYDPDTEERDDTVIKVALMWSLGVIVVLGVVGGVVAMVFIKKDEPSQITETESPLPELADLPEVEAPAIPFVDITESAGIDFRHQNGAAGEKLLPETMGGGCGFLDYDNDGDADILFVNSKHWDWSADFNNEVSTLALYENDGKGDFKNVTEAAGLNISVYGQGCAFADFDNDGNVDIFIAALGSNLLLKNEGGKFTDATKVAGVGGDADAWSSSAGCADIDGDGDLDLFVCNYLKWSREYDIAQNFQLTGGGRAYGRPQAFDGVYPYLYRNDGDGKFTDISKDAGVQVNNVRGTPLAKSLAVTFCDFDQDGGMDIMVANDTVQNLLFVNQGEGKFAEMGAAAGVAFDSDGKARGAMGLDTAHFRNSNAVGIAIGNFSNEMSALYVQPDFDLQFTDEAVPTGLGPNTRLELTFGVFYADFDLDGRVDFFSANGHLEEEINKVQSSQHYEQPPQLFWNCGPENPTEFMDVSKKSCGADFVKPLVGRGAGYADIDSDGDIDVLITASGQAPRLLRNDQQVGHHWLRLKLNGSKSNRDAIGARVELKAGGTTQRRQVMPTKSYLSQSELAVTFGLGQHDKVDKLTITWPDGSKQDVTVEKVDQALVVEQE
ncbi:MAG: RNA-binding protein [Planctomycetaceae bacterium]|nr:RNA-binding protein [Planctomycetaceae bacterium]